MSEIFVFGSNEAGRHGRGAAKFAREHHGAIYGQGEGLQGNSYAIPTRDHYIHTLPISTIKNYVNKFIEFAKSHPELVFHVTAIGTGLAGYNAKQIAPLFENAFTLRNVRMPKEFLVELLALSIQKLTNKDFRLELNDHRTQELMKAQLDNYLHTVCQQRGLPIEEFEVVCNEQNNPLEDIEQGKLNVTLVLKGEMARRYKENATL